ncbi:MAG TPA: DNA-processing protein DprA, partial [Thermoanaerobaculia bacterium]|nr:DNA-processing protein DprA [Thermoanaerobaculia bacterium]
MPQPTPEPARERRELLIALGASQELPRPAACRLAAKLDAWVRSGRRRGPATAGALGVPTAVLAAAGELRVRAGEIARRESARARELGARIVTLEDAAFPPALRDLELPPPCLWVRGVLPGAAGRTVAIVGSRRADPYGREVAELFGRELAEAGLAVVSGFARGIDAAAHRGALAAQRPSESTAERVLEEPAQRQPESTAERPADEPPEPSDGSCLTAAVLGSGLGVDYPREHRRLG